MSIDKEKSLSEVKKSIIKVNLFMGPGTIASGLGLYGVVAANGNAFFSVLNSIEFCYSLIAVGVVVQIIGIKKLWPLLSAQRILMDEANT